MLTSSSFRLQKLSKSMEMRSESFSKSSTIHTPRISAMNSVNRSVKYNDLSFITGQQMCKLRRQPNEAVQDPQYSLAHTNMAHIRNKFDKTSQQKLYLENKIQRLNEEKNKYNEILKQFQQSKISGKGKVTSLQSQLQSVKNMLLDRQFQKKSIQQMAEAIKHDKIIYDKRKFDMDKYLKNLQFKSKTVKEGSIHLSEEEDRVLKVYQKLTQQLNREQKERQQHTSSLEIRIVQKQNINNSSILRQSVMVQIAQRAMIDRDPQQKQWLKVFDTHRLLQKMLKSKIQRQMQKFSTVEEAFKQIKISTGVSDAKTMVTKFLTKQEIYGDLLSKIAQNEKIIIQLKKQQQLYFKQIKINQEEINVLEVGKGHMGNFREQLKESENIWQKRRRCDYQQQKIKQFLFRHQEQLNKNMRIEQNNHEDINRQGSCIKTKQQLKDKFVNYITKLSKFIDASNHISIKTSQISHNQPSSMINQQLMARLFRVKALVQSNNVKQMNSPDQFVENFEEQQIPNQNDQVQAFEEQRQNLMKSNDKFMKELRHRREEEKKLIVQTLLRNTKEKAPTTLKKVQKPQQQ